MSEEVEAVQAEEAPINSDADYLSGYSDEPTTQPDAVDEKPEEVAEPVIEPPKLATITEDEYQELRNRAAMVDEIKSEHKRLLDTAFGKIGGMQQLIEKLQNQTPQGQNVEITEEDMKDISEEYPELGGSLMKTLQKVLSKTKGVAPVREEKPEPVQFDPSQVESIVQQRLNEEVEKLNVKMELRDLTRAHPDWQTVRETTDFSSWRDSLPQAERDEFNSSMDAGYVSSKLTEFKTWMAKKQSAQKETAKRQDRLRDAVQPKGTGGHNAQPTEDHYSAGFKQYSSA